jgi:hypothetical protein
MKEMKSNYYSYLHSSVNFMSTPLLSPSRRPSLSSPRPPSHPSQATRSSAYFAHPSRVNSSSSTSSFPSSSASSYSQLTSLRDENHGLQSELAAARAQINKFQRQLSALSSVSPSFPSSSPLLSSSSDLSLSDFTTRIFHLEREVELARQEAETSKSALFQASQLNNTLQTEKNSLEVKVSNLQGLVQEHEKQVELVNENAKNQKAEKEKAIERVEKLANEMRKLEGEVKALSSLSSSSARESYERAESQAALLSSANSHARQVQALQNELQAARQFIEELKSEFESFAIEWRTQAEQSRIESQRQVDRLRDSLAQQLEKSQVESISMASEQTQILAALQEQFDHYRSTAEQIFQNEANSLKLKLERQQTKFEEEIRLLNRTKEEEMSKLILSKDAKILALIEGTEMQKILLRHQTEMEILQKSHQTQLESVRMEAKNEQRAVIEQLKKDLEGKQMEIERFHAAIGQWEVKLDQTVGLLKKQKRLHLLKEEQNEKSQKELLNQLKEAHEKIEELIRVKENLRHRILRLRLQLEGAADESVQATIKRLTKDSASLSGELEKMKFHCEIADKEKETLVQEIDKVRYENESLQEKLSEAVQEQQKITRTFERFLKGRLKGLTGAERQSLLPREPAAILDFIGEFAEKTLKRMEMEQTKRANEENQQNNEKALKAGVHHPSIVQSTRSVILENGLLVEREEKDRTRSDYSQSNSSLSLPVSPDWRSSKLLKSSLNVTIDQDAMQELDRGFQQIEKFKRENERIRMLQKTSGSKSRKNKTKQEKQTKEGNESQAIDLGSEEQEENKDGIALKQANFGKLVEWPNETIASEARELVKIYQPLQSESYKEN